MADDEDEGAFGGLYEDGHWIWDEVTEELVFKSDLPPKVVESVTISSKAPLGAVEFRDDVDLIEQIRFRRRYQRKLKPGEADVITMQDVKDIALFTAPTSILTADLINLLHITTTERFLRGLVLYCQYYLQTADEMTRRRVELETKIRTEDCKIIENEYKDNLSDLRLLIAKEYSTMLLGGADTRRYHHMGISKKRKSLSDKDARLIESLIRMSVQITWLCLGRKSFNQIELEINRLFKSEAFNSVEHTLRTGYIGKMTKTEHTVLLGSCLRYAKKIYTRSPVMNEVFCHRQVDYRMLGLGVIKYPNLMSRFVYMHLAIAGPEEELGQLGVAIGILGMPRSKFDTMLHFLSLPDSVAKSNMSTSSGSNRSLNKKSAMSTTTTKSQIKCKLKSNIYAEIELPEAEPLETFLPPSFPDANDNIRHCSDIQRRRWQNRLKKLLHPHK